MSTQYITKADKTILEDTTVVVMSSETWASSDEVTLPSIPTGKSISIVTDNKTFKLKSAGKVNDAATATGKSVLAAAELLIATSLGNGNFTVQKVDSSGNDAWKAKKLA